MPINNRWMVLAAMCASMTVGGPVWSEEADDGRDNNFVLDEVTVTATKRSASLQNVAVAVTAFSSDAIARINPADSNELLSKAPNLQIRLNSGTTNANIFMRGVGSTGISFNLQSGVGVYSDEVVLNSPVVNILQLFDQERVEVLRGPQNTLYGRNTTGGAVNFISRKPEVGGEFNGTITGTYGRFDQFGLDAAVGAPLGDKAAIRVAGQYQSRAGIRKNLTNGTTDDELEKFAARVQLAFEPSDTMQINLKGHLERVRSQYLRVKPVGGFDPNDLTQPCATPNVIGACADSTGFVSSSDPREVNTNLQDPRNDVNAGGASAQIKVDFESMTLTSITAYEENSQELSDDSDGTAASGFHFYLNNEQQQFSQELRLQSSGDEALRWIIGAYFFDESVKGQTGPLFGTPMGTMLVQSLAEFDTTTYSAYGEIEYDLTDNLTLKGGLRYSSDNIKGEAAALLAFESFLPGVDLDRSLIGGEILPDFDDLAEIAVANGIGEFQGGAVGGGPNRLILVGGDSDPGANINDTTFNNWGGKIGLDYQVNDDVLVYAQWSRGFKAGRFNAAPMSIMDLNSEASADGVFRSVADVPIRPEKVDAYEIGVKTEFADGRARLNIAAFYNDYTDQQINQFIAGEFEVLNADSKIYGGEVELNWVPFEGFFIDGSLGLLKTEVQNPTNDPALGEKLPASPEVSLNFAARKEWEMSDGGILTIGADINHVGSRFFELGNVTSDDAYTVVNAQASYEFGPDANHRVSVWGKNIFNEVYATNKFFDGTGLGPDTAVLSVPATYGITVSTNF